MPTDMWHYTSGPRKGTRKPGYGQGSQWRLSAPGPDGIKSICQRFDGNKAAAIRAEENWRAEIEEGRGLDRKAANMTITAYSEIFRASRAWRRNTRTRMDVDWRLHIIPLVGHLVLKNVRKIHMETFAVQLEAKGLSARSRGHVIIALFGMFKSAIENGAMAGPNPLDGVKRPKSSKGEYWLPTAAQFQALMGGLEDRYQLILALAAGCGWRYGEIMGITLDDIVDTIDGGMRVYVRHQLANPEGEAAHLAPPKSEASVRSMIVPPSVAKMIRTHLAHPEWHTTMTVEDRTGDRVRGQWPTRRATFLFAQSNGRPMSVNYWGDMWRAVRASVAGVPDTFTLHGFRHLAITALILDGRSGPSVQVFAGHADLTTTLREYSHYFRLMDAKADDTVPLEALFAPAKSKAARAA